MVPFHIKNFRFHFTFGGSAHRRERRRAVAGRSPVNARSYLTDVPSIRCWRRDRGSESTFARGDDEPAVTVEFLTPKPNIDARKVDVRPNS